MQKLSDQRYQRQTLLPEVGAAGQQLIAQAKVLVVGAGGLGHPVIQYLAAAGIGTLAICDHDKVELSNLQRQILFKTQDIGQQKASLACQAVRELNPDVQVCAIEQRLAASNILEILRPYQIIIDCSDNFKTKFTIHDACFFLKKRLIQGSIYQFEGQLQNFHFKDAQAPCLRCLWQQVPSAEVTGNCGTAGVLGVIPGVLGGLQCNEALKTILQLETLKPGQTLTLNLKNYQLSTLNWKKNPHCPLCSPLASIKTIAQSIPLKEYELTHISDHFVTVDIRSYAEIKKSPFAIHCPLASIDQLEICADKTYLFICQKGIRGEKLVAELRKKGQSNTYSLAGGADAL